MIFVKDLSSCLKKRYILLGIRKSPENGKAFLAYFLTQHLLIRVQYSSKSFPQLITGCNLSKYQEYLISGNLSKQIFTCSIGRYVSYNKWKTINKNAVFSLFLYFFLEQHFFQCLYLSICSSSMQPVTQGNEKRRGRLSRMKRSWRQREAGWAVELKLSPLPQAQRVPPPQKHQQPDSSVPLQPPTDPHPSWRGWPTASKSPL